MSETTTEQDDATRSEVRRVLAENPAFARILRNFMALYDAAEVLDGLKPPQHEIAAPYLRAIADQVMREAIGEDFLQVMIRSRPPLGGAGCAGGSRGGG